MTCTVNFQVAEYLKSAVELSQLPADSGAEVAFIGRSNAGKSSALNTITGIKALARVSKTPGRTQAINLFTLNHKQRLVDLPGYGYAKVPLSMKTKWEANINRYLAERHCLRGLVLIMDVRHPLKELDRMLLEWAMASNLPVHILLTKADKLSRGAAKKTWQEVVNAVKPAGDLVSVQLFSSLDNSGVDQAKALLSEWLTANDTA